MALEVYIATCLYVELFEYLYLAVADNTCDVLNVGVLKSER